MRHNTAGSAEGGALDTSQPGTHTAPAPAQAWQLTPYITDPAGKLTADGRTAVERALSRLHTRRNVHLWVAYVDDFSGIRPAQWAQDTMRANGFTDVDGLLAIDTVNHAVAFRPPEVMVKGVTGARFDVELIRRDRIMPAVHHDEWARAAVEAADGLEKAA